MIVVQYTQLVSSTQPWDMVNSLNWTQIRRWLLGAHQSCHRIHRRPRGMNCFGREKSVVSVEKWLKPSPTWRSTSAPNFFLKFEGEKPWMPCDMCVFFQKLTENWHFHGQFTSSKVWTKTPGVVAGYAAHLRKSDWILLAATFEASGFEMDLWEVVCFFSSWTVLKIATIAACLRRHSEKNIPSFKKFIEISGNISRKFDRFCSSNSDFMPLVWGSSSCAL